MGTIETKDLKDTFRDLNVKRENKEAEESEQTEETKDSEDPKDPKETKETEETKDPKETKDSKRNSEDCKFSNESEDQNKDSEVQTLQENSESSKDLEDQEDTKSSENQEEEQLKHIQSVLNGCKGTLKFKNNSTMIKLQETILDFNKSSYDSDFVAFDNQMNIILSDILLIKLELKNLLKGRINPEIEIPDYILFSELTLYENSIGEDIEGSKFKNKKVIVTSGTKRLLKKIKFEFCPLDKIQINKVNTKTLSAYHCDVDDKALKNILPLLVDSGTIEFEECNLRLLHFKKPKGIKIIQKDFLDLQNYGAEFGYDVSPLADECSIILLGDYKSFSIRSDHELDKLEVKRLYFFENDNRLIVLDTPVMKKFLYRTIITDHDLDVESNKYKKHKSSFLFFNDTYSVIKNATFEDTPVIEINSKKHLKFKKLNILIKHKDLSDITLSNFNEMKDLKLLAEKYKIKEIEIDSVKDFKTIYLKVNTVEKISIKTVHTKGLLIKIEALKKPEKLEVKFYNRPEDAKYEKIIKVNDEC